MRRAWRCDRLVTALAAVLAGCAAETVSDDSRAPATGKDDDRSGLGSKQQKAALQASSQTCSPGSAVPAVDDFVLYAREGIVIGESVAVKGGNVGVIGSSAAAAGGNVRLEPHASVEAARTVFAPVTVLMAGSSTGPLRTDEVAGSGGTHLGVTPFPVLPDLPVAGVAEPGSKALVVKAGTRLNLAATKEFRSIRVDHGATLVLEGGRYDVADLTVKEGGHIEAARPAMVRVTGSVVTDKSTFIGPAAGTALGAGDLRLEVLGAGTKSRRDVAVFGVNATVQALVLAPVGAIRFHNRTRVKGAFAARMIFADPSAAITYEAGFSELRNLVFPAAWRMNDGEGAIRLSPKPVRHGDESEYASAGVPAADDVGWRPAPDRASLAFAVPSTLCGRFACLRGAQFTYFQTTFSIPVGASFETLTLALDGIDDGARTIIFNSASPSGSVVPGGTVLLGARGTVVDLAPFARAGEVNRVVVIHVDDCCSESSLRVGRLTGKLRLPPSGPGEPIDDGDPCTIDTCDLVSGRVDHAPAHDGTACDDEDLCDGAERCLAGRCTAGTPVVCSAQGQCREVGVCDPATGACTSPPRDDGGACDDGDACTLQDSCLAGSCVSGKPVACSSGDPCRTDGVCDPSSGLCSGSPKDDDTPCDDHDACTAGDSCQQGACRGGNPVTCPMPGTCRDLGTCDPATGACTDPPKPDGTACSSGGVCSTGDTCVRGVCKPGAPVICPPLDQCHDAGSCDPTSSTCVPVSKSNGTVCDDHNPCTRLDTCQAGACVGGDPVTCASADQCSDAGICNPTTGSCTKVPKPDGTSCNDGDACTRADSCRGGQCAGGEPVVCAAADQCHTQGTCDPSTGICSNPAKDDGTACDDKNPCTLGETCHEGTCSGATPVTCVAADECHRAGTCDPLMGLCSNPIKGDGELCQDGDACTQADSCQSGICVGENPLACVAQDSCHVAGICNPQTGACSNPPKPDGDPCNDGNPCTRTDACLQAACVGSGPVSCVAADACHLPGVCEVLTGSCTTPPAPDGTPCSDGSACTAVDTCAAGACVGAEPKTCPPSTCRQVWSCDPGSGSCVASVPPDTSSCAAQEAMVIGQVLSDATGAPMDGATVRMGAASASTKAGGRYALLVAPGEIALSVEREGFTSVDRSLSASAGVGNVAVDARLTPLADAFAVGAAATTLTANLGRWTPAPVPASISIAAGAVAPAATARFTPLTAQGLPGLLPLGWSPLVAFDLRASSPAATVQSALPLTVQGLTSMTGPVYLVSYDSAARRWRLDAALSPEAGSLAASITRFGAHAVVVPDASGTPAVPATGEPLPGVDSVAISPALSAFGAGEPQTLPASGGVIEGRIVLPSTTPTPSGTVLSAAVSESYNLTAGPIASAATRIAHVSLFRTPIPTVPGALTSGATSVLGASFAVTPSRSHTPSTLARGNVHIDVLAGREAQRGKLGGLDAVSVSAGDVTISVASGATTANTMIDVERTSLPDTIPRANDLVPAIRLDIDLGMATLTTPAELLVGGVGATAGESVLLARLERVDGVASPVLVALGTEIDGRLTFTAGSGLPGVTREGEYVVYRSSAVLGYVAGTTTAGGAGVLALVSSEGLPFIALSGNDGRFKLPVRAGAVTVRARVPDTNLAGSASAEVIAGETETANIALAGVVTVATVTPATGAVGVARSTQINLTTSAPLDPTTATLENLRVFLGEPSAGQQVAAAIEVAASNAGVAVIPSAQLQPGTAYTFEASGLKDRYGAPVPAVSTRFTTKVETPPSYDTDKITFSTPDANGNVAIDVPAGSLPPGTTILVTNEGNGAVVSFTVGNDGSLHETLLASIDDKLIVSVTDPSGATTTFRRSQYVGANGETAIGPGGGIVKGPGGSELRVPEGAVKYGTVFAIRPVDIATLPDRPPLEGGSFSALRVEVKGNPFFSKEIDIVFPKPPEAPDGAFYYVFKRHVGAPSENLAGGAAYEVIDHAFVEGTGANARVVTASCPFPGFQTAYAGWLRGLAGIASAASMLGLVSTATRGITAVLEDLQPDMLSGLVDTVLGSGLVPEWMGMLNDPGGALIWGSTMVLGYTYSEIRKNLPTVGIVHGRAVHVVPGSNPPRFEPVVGATVTGRDSVGRPLTDNAASDKPQPFTYTQADGTYVLWDMFPSQGNLSLTAVAETLPGGGPIPSCPPESVDVQCETAFQHVIEKCGNQTNYYANQASANFTFPAPAVQSGPIPPVTIRVMRMTNGQREPSGGVAIERTPLVIGFVAPDASVQTFEVEHHGIREPGSAVRRDTLLNQPLAVDQIADFTPTSAGTYTITATALPLPSGSAFTASSTFRVVAAGGDMTSPVPDSPPAVVTDRTIPANGSDGVPTSVTPQVVFTEPVLGVVDQVQLREVDPPNALVSVSLTGITRSGTPVDLDPSSPAVAAITSLTVQPKRRLKFGTKYELVLGSGIFDLDNTLPGGPGAGRTLQRTTTTFTTVVAQALVRPTQPTSGFGSPGIATAGDYAYLFESVFTYGLLHVFDVSNPADPVEFADAQKRALGRPMGIAAEENATGTGATIVVATGPADKSLPSNIRIYEAKTVTNTTPTGQTATTASTEWVGAATLSATAAEGIVQRVALKGNFAYAISTFKGLQVVDIEVAKNVFANLGGDVSDVRVPLNTDGMGVGQEAVVARIPILKNGRPAFLYDVKVAELNDGFLQPIAVIAGDVGLVLVNPQTAEELPGRPLEARGFRARAVDVGRIKGRDIAVVVGEQGGGSGLVVIDITDPRAPLVKGEMLLLHRPVGVKLKDDLVFVGTDSSMPRVEIVNVEDVAAPLTAGHIDNVAGNVAVAANGTLVTNMPAKAEDLQPLFGGVRTATLDPAIAILRPPVGVTKLAAGNDMVETLTSVDLVAVLLSADSSIQSVHFSLQARDLATGVTTQLTSGDMPIGQEGGRRLARFSAPPGLSFSRSASLGVIASAQTSGTTIRAIRELPMDLARTRFVSPNPVVLFEGQTKVLAVEGHPGVGSDYAFDVGDSEIAQISPTLPSQCPGETQCSVTISGVKRGTTDVGVTLTFRANGNVETDRISVLVTKPLFLNVTAFIPFEFGRPGVTAPAIPFEVVGEGDDRAFDSHSPKFRIRTLATLDPMGDPVLRRSEHFAGLTELFLLDDLGLLQPSGFLPLLTDFSNMRLSAAAIPGTDDVLVSAEAHATNAWFNQVLGLPNDAIAIDWCYTIRIRDATSDTPIVQILGGNDNYPAYEVYINDKLVHCFMPSVNNLGRLLGGCTDASVQRTVNLGEVVTCVPE
jgi:hypothetical protein